MGNTHAHTHATLVSYLSSFSSPTTTMAAHGDKVKAALAHFKEMLNAEWSDCSEADGIQIKSAPYKGSSVTAFYGQKKLEGNARKLADILWNGDESMYKDWDAKCLKWSIVENIDENTRIEYTLQDLPWP